MATTPPTIDALPNPPNPDDRATFNTLAYPWSVAQQTLATQVGAVAANVYANASEALTSANTATTKAAEALASANSASNDASAASGAAASAIAAFDSFDDRYLGAKANDPSTDNDGNALVVGALYYRNGFGMRVWNGSAWEAAYLPASGYLSSGDIGNTVQAQLVSGTNIKTINGQSVLGTGDLQIEGFTLAQAQATALCF